MIEIINNLFKEDEISLLNNSIQESKWMLAGHSGPADSNTEGLPLFWYCDIIDTQAKELFTKKITKSIKYDIVIDRLYVNGQAHGQCGGWHSDVVPGSINCFSLVFFLKEWKPEYGGHLLIKDPNVHSIIPEYNKAVLFDSTYEHLGMEPTIHCKTHRESIACKFRVI